MRCIANLLMTSDIRNGAPKFLFNKGLRFLRA